MTEREVEREEEREEREEEEQVEREEREEREEKEEKGEEREEAGEVVFNVGPRRIERRYLYENSIIDIVFVEYPVYPYRNKVSTFIRLDKKTSTIEVFEKRENWGGTKVIEHGMVKVDENEFDKLLKKVMKIKDPDDFEEITETFERMLEERMKRFDEILDKVLSKFADVYILDRALSLAKNIETLKELKKVAKQCIKDWLA